MANRHGGFNLDGVEDVGVHNVKLDLPWYMVTWCNPSCRCIVFQPMLKGTDGLLRINVGVAPVVFLQGGQDVSLNP